MDARCIPPSGESVFIYELSVPSQWVDKSVNVTGRLDKHDPAQCRACLVDPKSRARLQVDTTLVEPFDPKISSLFQFIGEMKPNEISPDGFTRSAGFQSAGFKPEFKRQKTDGDSQGELVLKARIVRCVDGLDLVRYEQALKTQREYLRSRPQT